MRSKFLKLIFISIVVSVTGCSTVRPDYSDLVGEVIRTKALDAHTTGPRKVSLSNQAVLDLPQGYYFTSNPAPNEQLRFNKNFKYPDSEIAGDIAGKNWFAFIKFEKVGYLKNNHGDLLVKGIALAAADKGEKVSMSPYDSVKHQIKWNDSVNIDNRIYPMYATLVFGREGYFCVGLVSFDNVNLAEKEEIVQKLADAIKFNEGKTYNSYVEGKDKLLFDI